MAVHHGPERNLRKDASKTLSFHNVYSEALLDACLLRSVAKAIYKQAKSFFEDLQIEGLKYVIRLNTANNPTITHDKGKMDRVVRMDIAPGQANTIRGVYYKGNVKMNLAGSWKKGMSEAMWVDTNIDPKDALHIYLDRMKIEESFKDLKSLLGLERIMSKDRQYIEKLIMLVLIAYTIGVLVGEKIRDWMYRSEKKWNCYSGLFILIRQRVTLPAKEIRKMKFPAYRLFQEMLNSPGLVPT